MTPSRHMMRLGIQGQTLLTLVLEIDCRQYLTKPVLTYAVPKYVTSFIRLNGYNRKVRTCM